MTDFDDDRDDDRDDADLGDPDATGRAAVLCTLATTGVQFRFVDSVSEALRLAAAHPCSTKGCVGGHTVVYRDECGHLRIVRDDGEGDHQVIRRMRDLVRTRERRKQLRARVGEAARQQRRRAEKRRLLGGSDRVDP